MGLGLSALLALSLVVGERTASSVLYQPSFEHDDRLREPAKPFQPEPGDIVLFSTHAWYQEPVYLLAGAGKFHHSAIVFRRPDGQIMLLEAWAFGKGGSVRARPVMEQIEAHSKESKIWVRKRRVPLTEEESDKLYKYAMAQIGVPFAWFRVALQVTPFRSRGDQRMAYMGKPQGNRQGFWCAELVTEACVAAGLLAAEDTRPSATYPCDLFPERSPNAWLAQHMSPAVNQGWQPPARWSRSGQPPQSVSETLPAVYRKK